MGVPGGARNLANRRLRLLLAVRLDWNTVPGAESCSA